MPASAPDDAPDRPGARQWVPPAGGVEALRSAAPACRGCELHGPATQVVFSAGNPAARAVLVGEQPGDVEDRQGIPFVGPAGRLLQRALDEAGVDRADVYVTNAVKHFRFEQRGNRRIHQTPELAHMTACRPWLEAELAAVDPEVVVVLGATAAKTLLGPSFRVTRERGVLAERDTVAGRRPVLPTVHPSSVLRGPEEQREEAFAALAADLAVLAHHLRA
ncbi:UdgX family uracil-DNA binding protein [Aquipuribacter nitratireducens]|uniref:Type-4 uracil-DNA glycosylase n=1 Tax=Aquipuribacter nitratireducens TaxID=650104 RepID=A0ABW0GQM9_9MICO